MPDPKIPGETVRGNVYIRNMLTNIERTFLPIGSIIGKYRIVEEIDRIRRSSLTLTARWRSRSCRPIFPSTAASWNGS
jgi:hypothetical protein